MSRISAVGADVGSAEGSRRDRGSPRRRHPRQQPRHLRAEAVLRNPGRGMAANLRRQRDERRSPRPPLRGPHGRTGLGTGDLHLQRVRRADPGGDGPLRDDQDRPARRFARARRDDHRQRRDRQLGPPRPDPHGGLRRDAAGADDVEQAGRDFIAEHRPTSLLGRPSRTEEIANMVVYIASEQASSTTGAALRVDGGVTRAIP